MDRGDFASALAENDAALAQPLTSPGDRALFQRGLIYSHPKNPGRDYHRSAEIFQQVVDRFPESDLSRTAQVLISLLHRMSDRERENRSLFEKLDQSRQELNKQKRTGEQYRSELDSRKAQVDQLNRQIEDLKNQIEKIKAIDLNIEKIKQKTDVR